MYIYVSRIGISYVKGATVNRPGRTQRMPSGAGIHRAPECIRRGTPSRTFEARPRSVAGSAQSEQRGARELLGRTTRGPRGRANPKP